MKRTNILLLILVTIFISSCGGMGNWVIEGDSIVMDDANIYLNITPHTITSSGWVYAGFRSKIYEGDVDFVFGFDTTQAKPTALQLYSPHNVTYDYTCEYDFVYTLDPNYFWCYENFTVPENGTTYNITYFEHYFDGGNPSTGYAWWNEWEEWADWNPTTRYDYEYDGMTTWYLAQDQHINAEQDYNIRYYLSVPYESNGKYALALKPSSETIEEAIANGHFYYLDPWYDTGANYLLNNLVSYYRFEEGLNDSQEYFDGECGGGQCPIYPIVGKIGDGVKFVPNDLFNISTNLFSNETSFSIGMWLNYSAGTEAYIAGYINGVNNIAIYQALGGELRGRVGGPAPGSCLASSTGNYGDSQWHYVLLMYNAENSSCVLFVDNVQDGFEDDNPGDCNETVPFNLGNDKGGTTYYSGLMDEVAVWHKYLNWSDREALYNVSNGFGYSHFDNGTLGGGGSAVSNVTSCTLINISHSDLTSSSTGNFSVTINCTNNNSINVSKMLLTRTVDFSQDPGTPNFWSIRPPSNNKGQNFTDVQGHEWGNILRADGRADDKWYDYAGIFEDNFTYSVAGIDSIKVNITNSSDSALLNFTWKVEPAVFRSSVYLSRGKIEGAPKKNLSITSNSRYLQKFYNLDAMRGYTNYSCCMFLNINITEEPDDPLDIYYCNQSYDPTAGVKPQVSSNCGAITSIDDENVNEGYYISRNSTYTRNCFLINNSQIVGVGVTDYGYFYYSTSELTPNVYNIRYADDVSGTNTTFNQTQTVWKTINKGIGWTQQDLTIDSWISTINLNDEFQLGIYAEDYLGISNYTNFSLVVDTLSIEDFPITSPDIAWIWSSGTGYDERLNATHTGNIQIRVLTSFDPNSNGTVNHSLYLTNETGQTIYTINSTFFSPNDADLNITFDSQTVAQGKYNLNITAVSTENGSNIESVWVGKNFTLGNNVPTAPTQYSPSNNSNQLNTTVLLYCNGSYDADGDTLRYVFFNNTNETLQNTTATNYSWASLDPGYSYNWSCRADDGHNISNLTGQFSFSIINVTNCSFVNATFNITILNEETRDNLTSADFESTFTINSEAGEESTSLDLVNTNNSNFKICFDKDLNITEAMWEFESTGYDPRQHYLFDTFVNASKVHSFELHLLNISLATGTTFVVTDASGNPEPNVYIYVERYYVGEGLYRTIAMGKTDSNGEDYIFLRHEDAWYRYKLYRNNDLIFQSQRKHLTETTETIRLGAELWSEYGEEFGDVQCSLSFNEDSDTFTGSFSTTSGLSRIVCMKVEELVIGGGRSTEYDTCLNSPSGTLQHTVDHNESNYYGYMYMSGSPFHILIDFWREITKTQNWGSMGILIVIGLIAMVGLLGITMGSVGTGVAVVISVVVLYIAQFIGIVSLSSATIIGLVVIAGFIAFRVGVTNR